jgi:hypothetical protein
MKYCFVLGSSESKSASLGEKVRISVSLKSFRRMKHRLSDYVNKLLGSIVSFFALLLTGTLLLLLYRQVRSTHVANFEVLKNKVRIRYDDAATWKIRSPDSYTPACLLGM